MQTSPAKVEHLYIHVPFCATKCRYCAFYSTPDHTETMAAYVDAVAAELQPWTRRLVPQTIFFGGGTPSVLPAPLLQKLFEGLRRFWAVPWIDERPVELSVGSDRRADRVLKTRRARRSRPTGNEPQEISKKIEWTVECNPATVSPEKMAVLKAAGVNRISLGVQSLEDSLLLTLGRIHTAETALTTYRALRAAGFDNLNLDLMFGLPGQRLEQWRTTLARAIDLQPEHFSTYCLSFEEDTEFFKLFQAGHLQHHAERELAMYELAIETLTAAGYRQYEISNFAKPGRECRHNIAGWEGRDYLGLGPSACSTVAGRRWQNIANIDQYVAGWKASLPTSPAGSARQESRPPVIEFEEQVSETMRDAERMAFGMRMNAGVPAEVVRGRWDPQVSELLAAELVEWYAGRLQPTRRGILFADEVAAVFV